MSNLKPWTSEEIRLVMGTQTLPASPLLLGAFYPVPFARGQLGLGEHFNIPTARRSVV